MTIDQLKDRIPDFAKDVRLNLASMMADATLSPQSKYGLLLASAIAARNGAYGRNGIRGRRGDDARGGRSGEIRSIRHGVERRLLPIYLASNPEYKTMPARLRMNWLGNPRVDRTDFQLWALAVSTINGCGTCMDAHEKTLRQSGISSDTIQTAGRFAAIVQLVAVAIEAAGVARHKRRSNPPSLPPSPRPFRGRLGVDAHIHEPSSPSVP